MQPEKVVAFYNKKMHNDGKTCHWVDGVVHKNFDQLKIVCYGEREYNLLYMKNGIEITDTGHDSIEGAIAQASYEFAIDRDDWVFVHCNEEEQKPL